MPQFYEYDPVTNIRTDTAWDENAQEMTLIRTADVEPNLDRAKSLANEDEYRRLGIKEGWYHYAQLPPIVILQMRAKGIDVFNRDHQKRMFEEINTNYPHLKATTGHEFGKVKQTFLGK